MNVVKTELDGVLLLELNSFGDSRGSFTKSYNDEIFKTFGIDFHVKESFYTVSKQNVVRGMHFQEPPFATAKLVSVLYGKILDLVLDLRVDSQTYGRFLSRELNAQTPSALLIPEGFAHGFVALEEDALVSYLVSQVYSKEHDTGIRFNSFGFEWPTSAPIVSARDLALPLFQDYHSPFHLHKTT